MTSSRNSYRSLTTLLDVWELKIEGGDQQAMTVEIIKLCVLQGQFIVFSRELLILLMWSVAN